MNEPYNVLQRDRGDDQEEKGDDRDYISERLIAQNNWQRYEYGRMRGHREYVIQARRCEKFYLGGGEQWDEEDRAYLEAQGRPVEEINELMPAVNSAIGYQIHNRMDISFKPRGGDADSETAKLLSKVVMQVADDQQLHWKETQVFSDGLIQQRGYFDIRMDFTNNALGEICIGVEDPLDVIPDPDAKQYEPETWSDVIKLSWMTYDEIEERWGLEARLSAESEVINQSDWGDDNGVEGRNKFGNRNSGMPYIYDTVIGDTTLRRVRVIDRQQMRWAMQTVVFYPSGDIKPLDDDLPEEKKAEIVASGGVVTRRMSRRVRWIVSTFSTVLHDGWSPYPHYTIVPFFPYFRRGKTRGMIDNGISPQRVLNKSISQYLHIINTSANSGWAVEEDSLTNMETEDLEDVGAKTGLVVEYKKGATPPQKIQPNQIPQGVDHLIERSQKNIRDVTGSSEAMQGQQGPEVSGIAIQSKQFAAQQQLAVPLDNLARTRHLLAKKIMWYVQNYYDSERIIRITESDQDGREQEQLVTLNQYDPATGGYLNDLTVGEYDVVISEVPMQVTFENSQFTQALELRKAGVNIPDDVIVRHSNIADKAEVIERMSQATPPNPLEEAEIALKNAQAKKTEAEQLLKNVEAHYSAIQTGEVIAAIPQVAPVADMIMKSSGYVVQQQGQDPNLPIPDAPIDGITVNPLANKRTGMEVMPGGLPPPALRPASPLVGAKEGIETPRFDGVG